MAIIALCGPMPNCFVAEEYGTVFVFKPTGHPIEELFHRNLYKDRDLHRLSIVCEAQSISVYAYVSEFCEYTDGVILYIKDYTYDELADWIDQLNKNTIFDEPFQFLEKQS